MAASLAALALGISDPTRHLHFDAASLWLYLAALMLVATLLATAVEGRFRHPALGLAAGPLLRRSGQLHQGAGRPGPLGRPGRRDPFAASARRRGLAGVTAFFCFQRALQTNRPLTAIAVMEAGAAGGGVMAGFIAFGDSLGTAPGDRLRPPGRVHRGRHRRLEPGARPRPAWPSQPNRRAR